MTSSYRTRNYSSDFPIKVWLFGFFYFYPWLMSACWEVGMSALFSKIYLLWKNFLRRITWLYSVLSFLVWLQQLQGTDILVRVTTGVRKFLSRELSAVLHSPATVLCCTKFQFMAHKSLPLLSRVCADGCSTREEMANYLLSNLMARLNKTCVRNSLSQRFQEPVAKGIVFSQGCLSQKAECGGVLSLRDSAVKLLSSVHTRNIICIMKLISTYQKGCIPPRDEAKQ